MAEPLPEGPLGFPPLISIPHCLENFILIADLDWRVIQDIVSLRQITHNGKYDPSMIKQLLIGVIISLSGVITGWYLTSQTTERVIERTADLQNMPAFAKETSAFVQEFTEFYRQQADDFKAFANSFYAVPPDRQKAFVDEALIKFSNAKAQTDLLGFKAVRYFHGNPYWLAKFDKVRELWNSAEDTTDDWCQRELGRQKQFDDSISFSNFNGVSQAEKSALAERDTYLTEQFSRVGEQLSRVNAELREDYVSKLKGMQAENSFFCVAPTPTPVSEPFKSDSVE